MKSIFMKMRRSGTSERDLVISMSGVWMILAGIGFRYGYAIITQQHLWSIKFTVLLLHFRSRRMTSS
jgi:hypothetical protein